MVKVLGLCVASCLGLLLGSFACSSSSSKTSQEGGIDGGSDATDATMRADAPSDARHADGPTDAGRDASSDAPLGDAPAEGGGPLLLELSVSSTGDATPGLTMIPEFSPTVFDYYVRCAEGTNALTVSMTASPGAQAELLRPTHSAAAPKQTLSVNEEENEAIVAAATSGTLSNDYWVRCLPHDFPVLTFTRHPEAGAYADGYYLVGNFNIYHDEGPYAMVLNSHGVPVWYSRASDPHLGVSDVSSLRPDSVTFKTNVQGMDFPFRSLDLDSGADEIVTTPNLDLHDIQILPNGDYVVITEGVITGVNLTGLQIPLPDGGVQSFGDNSTIVDCNIVELEPNTNKIVWSWDAYQHFDPRADLTFKNEVIIIAGTDIVQPYHCNSVAVDKNNNLLVSGAYMDSIFYIERPSGRVLWKMGGAKASLDNAVYVDVEDPFFRQHDGRLQASWNYDCKGGSGEVTVYDDETATGNNSRAVAYDVTVPLPSQADGGIVADCGALADAGSVGEGKATKTWQYEGAVPVAATGSFRISPEGSRVIGWGYGPLVFSEVSLAGASLLDFHMTPGDSSYRALKVPLENFHLDVLRNTAGKMTVTVIDAGP